MQNIYLYENNIIKNIKVIYKYKNKNQFWKEIKN